MGRLRKNQPGYVQKRNDQGKTYWAPDGSDAKAGKASDGSVKGVKSDFSFSKDEEKIFDAQKLFSPQGSSPYNVDREAEEYFLEYLQSEIDDGASFDEALEDSEVSDISMYFADGAMIWNEDQCFYSLQRGSGEVFAQLDEDDGFDSLKEGTGENNSRDGLITAYNNFVYQKALNEVSDRGVYADMSDEALEEAEEIAADKYENPHDSEANDRMMKRIYSGDIKISALDKEDQDSFLQYTREGEGFAEFLEDEYGVDNVKNSLYFAVLREYEDQAYEAMEDYKTRIEES